MVTIEIVLPGILMSDFFMCLYPSLSLSLSTSFVPSRSTGLMTLRHLAAKFAWLLKSLNARMDNQAEKAFTLYLEVRLEIFLALKSKRLLSISIQLNIW